MASAARLRERLTVQTGFTDLGGNDIGQLSALAIRFGKTKSDQRAIRCGQRARHQSSIRHFLKRSLRCRQIRRQSQCDYGCGVLCLIAVQICVGMGRGHGRECYNSQYQSKFCLHDYSPPNEGNMRPKRLSGQARFLFAAGVGVNSALFVIRKNGAAVNRARGSDGLLFHALQLNI